METTSDGRLLISQSNQVDVFTPVTTPAVAFTNPADEGIVTLPKGTISVTFDQEMYVGDAEDLASVLNPENYQLIKKTVNTPKTSVSFSDSTPLNAALLGVNPSEIAETSNTNFTAALSAESSPDDANYALELESGDSIVHNRFIVVPDWGVLCFDLCVPDLGDGSGTVDVSMQSDVPGFEDYDLGSISLTDAVGTPAQYLTDRYKIGYGTQGFETFHLPVPNELRGKEATLTFEANGNTVYLDDVFFQSESLLLGNPTFNGQSSRPDTRFFADNYLIEKPQYSLSYNSSKKIPNWVSYKLDQSWLGDLKKLGNSYWRIDPEIPSDLPKAEPINYKNSGYDIGHMATESHLKRNRKDQFATYLLTDALPQHRDNNADFDPGDVINPSLTSAWVNFESYLKDLVEKENKELYIISGGFGSLNDEIAPDNSLVQAEVTIPSATWKVAVVLEPGQDISDITADTRVVSIVTPNIERPRTLDPDPILPETDPKGVNYWRYWGNWRYSVDYIEDQTGLDLLNNIPKEIQDVLELNADEGTTTVNTFDKSLSASLLGSPVISEIGSSDTKTSLNPIKTSANKNGVVQFGMVQVGESQISPTQVSPIERDKIEFSPTEVSIPQVSPTQIAGNGIVSPPISTQVSPTQINSSQNSPMQVNVGQISIPQKSPTQVNPSEVSLTSSIPLEQILSSQSSSVENESSFDSIETSANQKSIAQISPTQISTSKVSPNQIGISEVNGTELGIPKNSIPENSLTQISPAQISTSEIFSTKIPLTSSVPTEQLLSSHNSTSFDFDNSLTASLNADGTEIINPLSVEYNSQTNTATLNFNALEASKYELIVDDNLSNPDRITLPAPYQVDFTAVSDFSALVDLEFTNTRSDR